MKKDADYRYERETYITILIPFLILGFLFGMYLTILNYYYEPYTPGFDNFLLIIYWIPFLIFLAFSIYSGYARNQRKKYLNSTHFYAGTVIGYHEGPSFRDGVTNQYYCIIKFQRNGRIKRFKTKYFRNSPCDALANTSCTVYELDGKYYPAHFTLRQEGQAFIQIPKQHEIITHL